MNKKKIYCQILICLLLTTVAVYGADIKNDTAAKYYNQAKKLVMQQMTFDEVKAAGAKLSATLSKTPAKVVSAVSKVNSQTLYAEPIDEKSDSEIKQVHAVAGGMVIGSGKDKEMGLYVKIRHESAISIYGNLNDIGVVESERVQRGEIIGSFDTGSGKEFYYELKENL